MCIIELIEHIEYMQLKMSAEAKKQSELKSKIEILVKEYNNLYSKTAGSKRLILENHDFFCRCMSCWYDYDGPGRDKQFGVQGCSPVTIDPRDHEW